MTSICCRWSCPSHLVTCTQASRVCTIQPDYRTMGATSPVLYSRYVTSHVMYSRYVTLPILYYRYVTSHVLYSRYVTLPVLYSRYVTSPVQYSRYVTWPVLYYWDSTFDQCPKDRCTIILDMYCTISIYLSPTLYSVLYSLTSAPSWTGWVLSSTPPPSPSSWKCQN